MIFKFLLILILTLRVSFFFLPSFKIDMNVWKAWSQRLVEIGPSNFYSNNYFSDYFPGFLYILWAIGSLFNFLSIPINSFSFELIFKTVMTIFDIGSAYFIYKIVSKYNKSWAVLSSVFYLLNPAIIFNSSIWGQNDGVLTFFLVYSIYLLEEKKKIAQWKIFTAFAILIKPQSLAILPVILPRIFRKFSIKESIKTLSVLFILLIVFSIPFFIHDPLFGLFRLTLKEVNLFPFTSLFAFNFWSLFDWWNADSDKWFIFSYKIWGLVLYAISLVLIIIPLFKKVKGANLMFLAGSLSFLAFYLFPTRIHERYLFPFFAFILISALIQKTKETKILIGVYLITSAVHLINLWYVYYFYNFVYNNISFSKNIFYVFISDYYKVFSLVLLASFAVVLFVYYRISYVKKS